MQPKITLIDRPCGTGKSSELISRLNTLDKNGPFLIITPLLDEVRRFEQAALTMGVMVHTPTDAEVTKTAHIRRLLAGRKNIITTHNMYLRLAEFARQGNDLLAGYHIIIDEVPSPIEAAPKIGKVDFTLAIIGLELATIDPSTKQVWPTPRWRQMMDAGVTGLYLQAYEVAASGRLFTSEGDLFVLAIPVELLNTGKELEILTYLSGGSLIRSYLDYIGAAYKVNRMEPLGEAMWRSKMRDLITIEGFTQPEGVVFSHSGQTERTTEQAGERVAVAIDNLFSRRWKNVNPNKTLITCAHDNFFANKKRAEAGCWSKRSNNFGRWTKDAAGRWQTTGLRWCANTTRGSNNWIDCTHAIYLYDQNPNPHVASFLEVDHKDFRDAFALTELVQWLWRTQVRKGKPITVAIPSERMRNLLINWLDTGVVSSAPVTRKTKCNVIWHTMKRKVQKRKLTPAA